MERAYSKLLSLPLLQGLSEADLTEIAGRVRLGFQKVGAGKYILRAGQKTEGVWFILDDGEVVVEHRLRGTAIRLEERLAGGRMFGAETLFGMNQVLDVSVRAQDACSTLFIRKQDIINHILRYEVCRFNLLGYLSLRLQKTKSRLATPLDDRLLGRLTRFLELQFIYPAGRKQVFAKMQDLARCLLCTRLNLSILLNKLEDEGLIKLGRMHFTIERLQDLINYNTSQQGANNELG